MLEAYARGVNAWIDERGRFSAEEFLLLGAPEPWSPVDSMLWGETMGVWLSHNWRTELARLNLPVSCRSRRSMSYGRKTARPDGRMRRSIRHLPVQHGAFWLRCRISRLPSLSHTRSYAALQ
ncbi:MULTISPECIES: penicillin acylase family protein [unclassified Bradyrhizobium]|uniref:penicillin acylase family protein n=1 Tax=unclassified Bradyrhizobium TaxID=2631580 RepID=UPI000A0210FA